MDSDNLGARFWLGLVGVIILVCVGAGIFFAWLGHAWAKWGIIGTIVIGMTAVIAIAWVVERVSLRNR